MMELRINGRFERSHKGTEFLSNFFCLTVHQEPGPVIHIVYPAYDYTQNFIILE